MSAIGFHPTSALSWFGPLAVASIVGCASAQPVVDSADTFVYRCEGEDRVIVVRVDDNRGHLFSQQASQPIHRQTGGTSFIGEQVSYLPDQPQDLAPGQTAAITIAGKALHNCRNDPRAAVWEAAKLRGVSYRAVGQEPPWVLEIDRENGFLLITDYAANSHRFAYSEPVSDTQQRSSRYRAEARGEDIVITIKGQSCRDSMSGETFSSRVEIEWREQRLHGCGRALH